jgi:hypothetical protein
VTLLFDRFARVLGPVGAAKSLHLLAPAFFPLWDQKIAHAYGLGKRSPNDYRVFMEVVQDQYRLLRERGAPCRDLLKAIDEYNYCKYTLGQDPEPAAEPASHPAEEPQRGLESMSEEEIDRELAAINFADAAKSEEQRIGARERRKRDRELLTELKRMQENGEPTTTDLGQ